MQNVTSCRVSVLLCTLLLKTPITALVLSFILLLPSSNAFAEDGPTKSTGIPATVEVIAEGAGLSADDAIKDAFRHAIRQAVGLVVDAETLVKNDEVVDDKILVYSDGFIKEYKEIAGSKKESGGLHLIKIKASVERRSLIAKLKAANITVTAVDGEGLFAEAVTQVGAETDAAALLKKQFEGFPKNLVTGKVVGRPELVEKTDTKATIRIRVKIEPDMEAYKTFVARLQPLLDKLSKGKGDFTAVFKASEQRDKSLGEVFTTSLGLTHNLHEWMPKSFTDTKLRADVVTLAVTTQRSKLADRLECHYYHLDKSLKPLLVDVGVRRLGGKLSLLDGDGKLIVLDRFPLVARSNDTTINFEGTLMVMVGEIAREYHGIFDIQGRPLRDFHG